MKRFKQLSLIALLFLTGCTSVKENSEINNNFENREITVKTCDLSGDRLANVKVDIGVDTDNITRNYYGYTNQYKQLIFVEAEELFLQTKEEEQYNGRYCKDEAKVKGTESKTLDEGHVIADSLGGSSNAYNITPQSSFVNREGSQYKLEQEFISILKSGSRITNLQINISYPDTTTQTPSKYEFKWNQNGSYRSLEFDNK